MIPDRTNNGDRVMYEAGVDDMIDKFQINVRCPINGTVQYVATASQDILHFSSCRNLKGPIRRICEGSSLSNVLVVNSSSFIYTAVSEHLARVYTAVDACSKTRYKFGVSSDEPYADMWVRVDSCATKITVIRIRPRYLDAQIIQLGRSTYELRQLFLIHDILPDF